MPNSTARSLSAPANLRAQRWTENDDEITEFPPLIHPDDVQDLGPGWWTREPHPSRSSRQSRASSIVSTRTRFSTTTLDEVRSIEISAGGNTYRISRDGSQITDLSAPPPYTGHSFAEEAILTSDTPVEHRESSEDDQENIPPGREARKRVRIVLPGEDDSNSREPDSPLQGSPADRLLTKADLYRLMIDLPLLLKQALGIKIPGPGSLTRSNTSSSSASSSAEANVSDGGFDNAQNAHEPRREPRPHSSDDILLSNLSSGALASSPLSSRYDDMKLNASQQEQAKEARSSTDTLRAANQSDNDQTVHMTVGDLNELSLLYNGVIRDLDREHRRKLHERDKEMERLRSLLHEKDIVYRQQLKAKDFVIEDQRAQLALQEDTIEKKLEMARNKVEDIWERRWKVQASHLMDRMGKGEDIGKQEHHAD